MARETFHSLIARNKRNSWFLILGFTAFFVLVGLAVGYVWGRGDMAFSVTVATVAAIVAFILTLLSYFGGASAVLGMSQAREIRKADDPQLFNVVEELSLAAGMPMPRIYVINDTAMNAFATGRNTANAVVAITMLMAVMVGTLVMLCDIFMRSLWFGAGSRRRRDNRNGGGAEAILMVVAIVLVIIAPILARIIQMALSRQREYLADAGSVALTRNPNGIASALAKLSGDQEVLEVANRATAPMYIVQPIKKFEERSRGLFDTHPPVRDRIKRLQQLVV
jgi:heat shock protein HtpX